MNIRMAIVTTFSALAILMIYRADASAQVLATVHQGDFVSITATLNTTDPNENGEGEPLVISGPGCSLTIGAYAFTQTVSCTASADGTITASISGADGDESFTASVTVSPAPPKDAKDPNYVRQMRNLRDFYAVQAALYGALAASPPCVAAEPCPFWAASIAAGDAILSIGFNRKAEDPIDPNFMTIDQPVVLTFPAFVPGGALTQGEADAINALLSNQEQALAYINASITAFNRAQGAAAAGSRIWQERQLAAFHAFDTTLGQLVTSQIALLTNLQGALQAAGFPETSITSSLVLQAELDILFGVAPLTQNLTQALANFGADTPTTALALTVISVQDIAVATGRIPSGMVTQTLIDTLTNNVTAFKLPVPKAKDDCKDGDWPNFARADGSVFKNQGDCVSYVNTGR